MRLLLDTHTFIWLDLAKDRLSTPAQQAIQDTQNVLYLSIASVWEIQIKVQLDKLHLNNSVVDTLNSQQQHNAIQLLPIQLNHILALNNLPHYHQDPFDRLLIAQAKIEALTLITNDTKIQRYEVTWLW